MSDTYDYMPHARLTVPGDVRKTLTEAADELLAMHGTTGLDITDRCPGLVALVALVYPNVLIEGSGVSTRHTITSETGGETGRYSLHDGQPLARPQQH